MNWQVKAKDAISILVYTFNPFSSYYSRWKRYK